MSIGVELIQAGAEHRSVLENLLQLYIHDFSEIIPQDVGDDGRYTYNKFPLYWSDPSRLPFLAKVDGKLAGFALVAKISEIPGEVEFYDMAEFFVLRRYRHRGIGREVARRIWLRCPGEWQVRVIESNVAALHFWASAIAVFTGRPVRFMLREIDGATWRSFSFDSPS